MTKINNSLIALIALGAITTGTACGEGPQADDTETTEATTTATTGDTDTDTGGQLCDGALNGANFGATCYSRGEQWCDPGLSCKFGPFDSEVGTCAFEACPEETETETDTTTGTTGTETDTTTGGDTDTTGDMTTGVDTTGTETEGTTGEDPYCGDGVVDDGEECDEGGGNAYNGTCLPTCEKNICGDGYVGPGEDCDTCGASEGCDECEFVENQPDGLCGNGVLDPEEFCDFGFEVNNQNPSVCAADCQEGNSSCGDGGKDAGEPCDPSAPASDNNNVEGCNENCTLKDHSYCDGWPPNASQPAPQR